jgi:hypothetical protein
MSFEGPEIEHGHHRHHGGLPRWLEVLLSVSALIVSLSSIAIALHHGEIMDKLVQANSLPYLDAAASDAGPDGGQRLSVDLMNRGVGPAHEQSLSLRVGDHYATSYKDLVTAIVGPDEAPEALKALRPYRNTARTRFVSANSSQMIFQIPRTQANGRWWDMMNKSVDRWHLEYCYCSVFHECWAVKDDDRAPIKACVRDPAREYLN